MEIDNKNIEMKEVESSNIKAIGYDPEENRLYVEFLSNGNVYMYADVSQEVFDGLMSSDSHGKYLARNVKNNYVTTRVRWVK